MPKNQSPQNQSPQNQSPDKESAPKPIEDTELEKNQKLISDAATPSPNHSKEIKFAGIRSLMQQFKFIQIRRKLNLTAYKESKVTKFFEVLKVFKERLAESEVLRIASGVLISLVALLILIPSFFDNSSLKSQLSQKVSQISGANFIIKGGVEVVFLPSPAIVIKDVLLQKYRSSSGKIYNLHVKSVKINLAPFGSSDGAFVKKIILRNATLNSYYEDSEIFERDDKIKEITNFFADEILKKSQETESQINSKKENSGQISAKLFPISNLKELEFAKNNFPEIEIKNATATFYNRLNRKSQIEALDAKLKIDVKKISASGNFSTQGLISNFELLAKFEQNNAKQNSYFTLTSPIFSLKITGNFPAQNQGVLASDFKGKIAAEIFDLKTFYKTYVSATNLIAKKIKPSAKSIKISGEIENNSAEILVNNLRIASELMSGKGDINFSFFDKIPVIDINFDLADLDLQSIWSDEPVEVVQNANLNLDQKDSGSEVSEALLPKNNANLAQKNLPPKFEFGLKSIKNIDLSAEIKIKNIKYLDSQIKDLDCYLRIAKEGEILFLPMTFRLPGEGNFRINGVLDNSQDTPKFIGKFDAAGKDLKEIFKWLKIESSNLRFENLKQYSLYSDLMLLPNSIFFDNFYFNLTGEKGEVLNEVLGDLKIDGSSKTKIFSGNFDVSRLDFDYFFSTAQKNIYLSPGSLLKKLLWLNEIGSQGDFDLNFSDLIYRGENFSQQGLKLKFAPGYLEISKFNLSSENIDFKGGILIDIANKIPRFELNFDVNGLQLKPEKNSKESFGQNLFEQFFALPSLEGFSGKFLLNLDNLELDDREIENLKLSGSFNDGDLKNAELTVDKLYAGIFGFKGLIGFKASKTINGNFTFNGVEIQPFLADLFGINQISGIANVSASITSVAASSAEFFKELNSNIKFNIAKPVVEGYGLNDLVIKMFAPLSYQEELTEPEKILFNPQTKTEFKQASGSIEIDEKKGGKINVKTNALAINGILSGSLDIANKRIDALFDAIFLTGNRSKQTPINIATNLKGKTDNLAQSTNINQARQYLGLAIIDEKPNSASEDAPKETVSTKSVLENGLEKAPQEPDQKSILLPSENSVSKTN